MIVKNLSGQIVDRVLDYKLLIKENYVGNQTNDKNPKEQLQSGEFITAPGVFDMISTLIATRMNFQHFVTGYGVSASYMGQTQD